MENMNYQMRRPTADRAAFPIERNALDLEERSYTALFPYNKPDFLNRIFVPGVFADFLANPTWQVQHLWVHNDFALPLGRVLELKETRAGLLFKAQFSDTVLGRDAWALVQDGSLNAVSISWLPIQVERLEKNGTVFRLQQKAKLLDVSPVNFGGMPDAKILRDMAAHFDGDHEPVAPDVNLDDCCGPNDACNVAKLPYPPSDLTTGDGTPQPPEGADVTDSERERQLQKLGLLGLRLRE